LIKNLVKNFEKYFILRFVMNKWLDADAAGTVRMELEPSSSEFSMYAFEIDMQTADEKGAGTDANISLYIEGDEDEHTFELNRFNSITKCKDLFERGNLDKFLIYGKDIGEVIYFISL
jgi:hypothetical protein